MSSKRPAATELNHDNWDKEEEPEERGKFRTASQDELKNRVIKKAKRHVSITNPTEGADSTKNIFGSFAGLCKETGNPDTLPFAFISKLPVSTSSTTSNFSFGTTISKQGAQNNHKIESKAITPAFSFTSTAEFNTEPSKLSDDLSEYYGKLKGLNQAVSAWIKVHVDKNPLCILTPIFKDYQKFLKDIEKDNAQINNDPINDLKTDSGVTKAIVTPPNTFQLSGSNIANTTTVDNVTVISPIPFANSKTTDSKAIGVKDKSQETNAIKVNPTTTFNFGSEKPTSSEADLAVKSFGFAKPSAESAVNLKTFSFINSKGSSAQSATASDEEEEDEDDQPPKVEFKAVIEENAFYSKRCKVFVKKNGNYADKGVGTLYLKQIESTKKTHLLVRADNNLGIVLVNLILSCGLPVKRMGKNNVMLFCLPTPETDKPTSLLLRVKTGEEADELLEAIEKYKK